MYILSGADVTCSTFNLQPHVFSDLKRGRSWLFCL